MLANSRWTALILAVCGLGLALWPAEDEVVYQTTRAPVVDLNLLAVASAPLVATGGPIGSAPFKPLAASPNIAPPVASSTASDNPSASPNVLRWVKIQNENRLACAEAIEMIEPNPITFEVGASRYKMHGPVAEISRPEGTAAGIRLGVLSGVKDQFPATRANVATFIAWFQEQGVDGIVLNGDIGYESDDIKSALTHAARSGLPVFASPGNAESASVFNRAVRDVSREFPNVINTNLVRAVDLKVGTYATRLVTIPGYHDSEYMASAAGCLYGDEALDQAITLTRNTAEHIPVVWVAHGPPRGTAIHGIDDAGAAGAVGDRDLRRAMEKVKVSFGIFGHILESGGRAVAGPKPTRVLPGHWASALWINAGSVSSLGAPLLDGGEHRGMAAVVEISGPRARYRMRRIRPN